MTVTNPIANPIAPVIVMTNQKKEEASLSEFSRIICSRSQERRRDEKREQCGQSNLLFKDDDERDEEDHGVDIVVVKEKGLVFIHQRKDFGGED